MSGAKRYMHISSLCAAVPELMANYPMATEYVLASDYDRLERECERLRQLSVTSIMLDVVPGCDGSGVEIYAESVADVEHSFGKLVDQIEVKEDERDELRAQVESMRAAAQGYLIACDEGEHEYQVKIARHNMRQVIAALQPNP